MPTPTLQPQASATPPSRLIRQRPARPAPYILPPILECHDWQTIAPLPPSDDGSWLSLFGLSRDWQES